MENLLFSCNANEQCFYSRKDRFWILFFLISSWSLRIRVCLLLSFVKGYSKPHLNSVKGFKSLSCLPKNASYHYAENLVAQLSVCKQKLLFFKKNI